jgi:hypothetical protein
MSISAEKAREDQQQKTWERAHGHLIAVEELIEQIGKQFFAHPDLNSLIGDIDAATAGLAQLRMEAAEIVKLTVQPPPVDEKQPSPALRRMGESSS